MVADRLEALPHEVLEEFALRLPLIRDRVSFLSASRRLHSLSHRSRRVWEEVGFDLDDEEDRPTPWRFLPSKLNLRQLASLGRWLGPRQQLVQQLHIGAEATTESAEELAALSDELSRLLGGLESGSLRVLQLECGAACVPLGGGLAAQLPGLESLSVRARSIEVDPSLSQLTRLAHLRLDLEESDHAPSTLPSGWLPPQLTGLSVHNFRGEVLPAQPLPAQPLPPLRQLAVNFTWDGDNEAAERGLTAQLMALTGLTYLDILTIATHHPTPRQLAALTNLEWVNLEGSRPPAEGSWSDLGPLLGMPKLTHISLQNWGLSTVPAALLALPQLVLLQLPGNPLEEPLAFTAACQLQQLNLGLYTAARSAAQLCTLPHLRTLILSGWPLPEQPPDMSAVVALPNGLLEMSSLEDLLLMRMHPSDLFCSWRAVDAYHALLHRPGLTVSVQD